MPDFVLSLIVIALTGIFIALLFINISRKKALKELEIMEYCQRKDYIFSRDDEPLRKELSIKGDLFLLTSTMVLDPHSSQTGSDNWNRNSVWRTEAYNAGRPAFLLGSVSASPGWKNVPVTIRNAAAQALLAEGYEGFSPDMADALSTPSGRAFLMFQRDRGSAGAASERILPLLDSFPAESRIVIHSEASGVTVKCSNFYVRSLDDARMLMDLGFACAGPAAV